LFIFSAPVLLDICNIYNCYFYIIIILNIPKNTRLCNGVESQLFKKCHKLQISIAGKDNRCPGWRFIKIACNVKQVIYPLSPKRSSLQKRVISYKNLYEVGSAKANGREPKSYLNQVFNFKLGCFVMCTIWMAIQACPSLQLKSWPRCRPFSLSLSMINAFL